MELDQEIKEDAPTWVYGQKILIPTPIYMNF